ncbi:amino acid adenylation domain-containing protein [Mycetohabitans sp. B46]
MLLHVTPNVSLQAEPHCDEATDNHDYLPLLITGRPASALCHGIHIRVGNRSDAGQLIARFDECIACAGLASDQAALWHEALPISSRSAAAARRIAFELIRPIDASSGALRAVVLAFADNVAELILIGSRRFIDSPALCTIAKWLTGANLPDTPAPFVRSYPAADEVSDNHRSASLPEWGLGGQSARPGYGSTIGQAWDLAVSPRCLIEAISVVLTRFDGQTQAEFGMIGHPDRRGKYGLPAACVVRVSVKDTTSVAELAAEVNRCLSFGPEAKISRDANVAPVGIVWNDKREAYDEAIQVRSYLTPPFDLTLEPCVQDGHIVRIAYGFNQSCFSLEMVHAFDRAVAIVCAELTREQGGGRSKALSTIGLLGAASASQIAAIGTCGALPADFTPFRIEQRIASFAVSQPNAKALSFEDRSLTYLELEELANRIAGVLRMLGVREGDRVGVCLARSLELVPVMLAVLKAGAAYVPIDPDYPADRIAYTLEDACPSLVVSAKAAAVAQHIRTIDVASLLERAAAFDGAVLPPAAEPSVAAYVIYTSGSTGRPKGVVVPHRNVASLVAATAHDFELSSQDTWTMFHSSAFDFSVWEVWGCLTTGGHLVVVPYWVTRSPDEFVQLLAREHVTVLNQTPSAFSQLIASGSCACEKLAVRLVVFGGEPLDTRMLLRWFDRYPETACRLVNMFGITETTVHVTAETLTRAHALTNSRTVGRALPGWNVYVMDAYGHMLPPGVPGEIYVGGAGVADQYLNREDLNAQRFLKDPFVGGRMYRSGDRGRLGIDGRLEHLGRLDNQVKIRGFRIELDEIRAVLLEYPYVSAAAVVVNRASGDDAASARLDAYVVIDQDRMADVRCHAMRLLPAHMVPSTFTALEALPLTANGKLDVSRLPAPTLSSSTDKASRQPALEVSQDPASDTLLEKLRCIWSDAFGVEVGHDDNFFELGGNSLFAVRIARVMREQGLPPLPPRELYLRQTLRSVVDYLNDVYEPA